jgi:hypothetical protein
VAEDPRLRPRGHWDRPVIKVTSVYMAALFIMITLFAHVTDVPMLTFAIIVTKVTSVYWLLWLPDRSGIVSLCGHFLHFVVIHLFVLQQK